MNWLDQLGGMLQQYAGERQDTSRAEQDFDQVSGVAPKDAMSAGLSEAFRSQQTPPFENMLGQLFGQSNGTQRAGLLNTLLAAAGPALLSGALSRGGGGLSQLAGLMQSGRQVTPEQAEQVSPQAVEQLAKEAQHHDPSIIDRASEFYAEHPGVVKGLGAAALAVMMSGMAKQKRGLF
jgi:hypothetical protein